MLRENIGKNRRNVEFSLLPVNEHGVDYSIAISRAAISLTTDELSGDQHLQVGFDAAPSFTLGDVHDWGIRVRASFSISDWAGLVARGVGRDILEGFLGGRFQHGYVRDRDCQIAEGYRYFADLLTSQAETYHRSYSRCRLHRHSSTGVDFQTENVTLFLSTSIWLELVVQSYRIYAGDALSSDVTGSDTHSRRIWLP
jgi:hypothetical protein